MTPAVQPGLTAYAHNPSTYEVEADRKFKIQSELHERSKRRKVKEREKREGKEGGSCPGQVGATLPTKSLFLQNESSSEDRNSELPQQTRPLEVLLVK